MTHHKNKNIHKSTRQKLRKNDVYQTKMHNIYNLIFDHTNKQLQEKAALGVTYQVVKEGWDPIRVLDDSQEDMIIESILTTTHLVSMPGDKAIWKQEHGLLPGNIL